MIVSNTELRAIQKDGGRAFKDGKPVHPKPTDTDLLREIAYQLRVMNEREATETPAPVVNVSPPEVTVEAPEVKVTVPPEPRPRKWEFEVTRNINGDITHITATANG